MNTGLRLGDCCLKIGSGATPRGGKSTYSSAGPFALIRSQNIRNEGFERVGLAFISAEQADALNGVTVFVGDVLLNITGDSVARVCQVPSHVIPARVNQHVAIIRPDPTKIDPRFLRFYLISPPMQSHMLGMSAAGATRNALTKGMIENFRVPALAIQEQRKIGDLLGILEDKIDLNRRMNETLEGMARMIFKDWFVDFGPVRAKMEGRDPPGLAPEIAALFPDRFGEDGLPTGWVQLALAEAANLSSGGTPSKAEPEFWGGSIPWISPKAMTGIHVFDAEDRVTETAVGRGTRLASSGSVLVMVRGMGLHDGVRISQARREVAFNQDVKAVIPKRLDGVHLLYGLLERSNWLYSKVESSGHGTGKLPTDVIESICFAVPPEDIRGSLIDIIISLNDKIAENEAEARTLAALGKLILPKLMSGELRVRNAVKLVEEVA